MSDMSPFDFLRYGYGFWLGGTLRFGIWTLLWPWYFFVMRALTEKETHKAVQYMIAALLVFIVFFRRAVVWFFLGAYRDIEVIAQKQAFSYTHLPAAILAFKDVSGSLALNAIIIFMAWFFACYDAGLVCDGQALRAIWRKARGGTKRTIWLFLRWGMIVPLLCLIEYRLLLVTSSEWPSLWKSSLLLPVQLVQHIQPHCPATYLDVFMGIGKVWLGFTASLALGVYLAPRQWLRHLWRGRWETARRLSPLALVQSLAALYLLLPWPLTLTYRFVSRVTCDPRFLVPPEPWRRVFALLNGAVFGVAISVLGLLVLQCYDEGRCWLGVEVAFGRLRPGTGRERAQQGRWGRWLYETRRWVVRPLLLGVGLWSGWQIGQSLLSALLARL